MALILLCALAVVVLVIIALVWLHGMSITRMYNDQTYAKGLATRCRVQLGKIQMPEGQGCLVKAQGHYEETTAALEQKPKQCPRELELAELEIGTAMRLLGLEAPSDNGQPPLAVTKRLQLLEKRINLCKAQLANAEAAKKNLRQGDAALKRFEQALHDMHMLHECSNVLVERRDRQNLARAKAEYEAAAELLGVNKPQEKPPPPRAASAAKKGTGGKGGPKKK